MKIININNTTFEVNDLVAKNPNEYEYIRTFYKTQCVKSTEVTDDDDGLDTWLINVKKQGHNELYIYKIEDAPVCYNPQNYQPVYYKLITYFSRHYEEIK
jgi:hypothetical protein